MHNGILMPKASSGRHNGVQNSYRNKCEIKCQITIIKLLEGANNKIVKCLQFFSLTGKHFLFLFNEIYKITRHVQELYQGPFD